VTYLEDLLFDAVARLFHCAL